MKVEDKQMIAALEIINHICKKCKPVKYSDAVEAEREAAEYILKNAHRLINSTANKQKWISTKDKLPEFKQRVLLLLGRLDELEGKVCIGHLSFIDENGANFRNEVGAIIIAKVTYWMPLPELPEEKKEQSEKNKIGEKE